MKILLINKGDQGGAATAIKRIHLSLLNKGIESKLLVLRKKVEFPETYSFFGIKQTFFSRVKSAICRIKERRNRKSLERLKANGVEFEVFSFPESSFDVTTHPLYKEADIIQLNWVCGFIDESSFFRKNKKPVVWRMADLYAAGDGYHYEKGFPFNAFKQLRESNHRQRQIALRNANNLTFVPISNWVETKAKESKLINAFPRQVIHNGLDIDVFKPSDQTESRIKLSLPLNKTILLFGAENITNTRKGFSILIDALNMLQMDNLYLCAFGAGEYETKQGIEIKKLGPIKDEAELAEIYSAASLFIMPSIEEAFGQVTIESLACGTPVVGFGIGGMLDILINGFNGILAKEISAKGLCYAIEQALATHFDRKKIVEDSHNRFNINDKADQYIKLYKSLL